MFNCSRFEKYIVYFADVCRHLWCSPRLLHVSSEEKEWANEDSVPGGSPVPETDQLPTESLPPSANREPRFDYLCSVDALKRLLQWIRYVGRKPTKLLAWGSDARIILRSLFTIDLSFCGALSLIHLVFYLLSYSFCVYTIGGLWREGPWDGAGPFWLSCPVSLSSPLKQLTAQRSHRGCVLVLVSERDGTFVYTYFLLFSLIHHHNLYIFPPPKVFCCCVSFYFSARVLNVMYSHIFHIYTHHVHNVPCCASFFFTFLPLCLSYFVPSHKGLYLNL